MDSSWVIESYISPNPSPNEWLLSGPDAAVENFVGLARQIDGLKIVARARDGEIGFVRLEMAANLKYGDFMGLINSANMRDLLAPAWRHQIPSRPDGRAEDLGDTYADPVIVGLLGAPEAVTALRGLLSWADFAPFTTPSGESGHAFEPTEPAPYQAFVDDAAAGRFAGVDVVLLRRLEP